MTTPSVYGLLLLQAEAGGPVPPQRLDLAERPLVEEQLDPLPDGQLALRVLGLGGPLARTLQGTLPQGVKLCHTPAGVLRTRFVGVGPGHGLRGLLRRLGLIGHV